MDTNILLAGVAVAAVGAYFFIPSFGQLVRTAWRGVLGVFMSDIAKQKDEYARLEALIPVQTKNAAGVMARAKQAQEDYEAAESAVTAAEAKFNKLKDAATPDEKRALAVKWQDAQKVAATKKAQAESLATEADEANTELEDTAKLMGTFAQQIQTDEGKLALIAAKKTATEVRNATKAARSAISAAGQASRNIDLQLKQAEAESDLSKGSKTDRALDKKEADMDADAAIAALEARSKPATPEKK